MAVRTSRGTLCSVYEDLDLIDLIEDFRPSPVVESLCLKQEAAYYGRERFQCVLAARQAGKSWLDAAWLLGGKPSDVSLYFARTVHSARRIMFPTFAEMNHVFDLGLQMNRQESTVTERSGAVIVLAGVKDEAAAESLRGPKYRKVVGDEAGTFHSELLQYAVQGVLQPTLIHTDGSLWLTGTPGKVPEGYFFDLAGDPASGLDGAWPCHHWNVSQNERIRNPEKLLADILRQNKWTRDNPTFRREWLAEWVSDLGSIIYNWTGHYHPVPTDGLTVMSLDFGVVDHTSFTVLRQPKRPHVYVCHSESFPDWNMRQIAEHARKLIDQYRPNYIVADEGALGKGYAKQLREVYQLHQIEPAQKAHKRARIDTARGMLSNDTLRLCAGAQELREEWLTLPWDPKRQGHHDRYKQDCSDGLLYGLTKILATEGYAEPVDDRAESEKLMEDARRRAERAASRSRGSSRML